MSQAQTPRGVNHVVLNVRNLEESHRFWTEVIGFKCVAALDPKPGRLKMRFYSGVSEEGTVSHHDLALAEVEGDAPPVPAESSEGHRHGSSQVEQDVSRSEEGLRARRRDRHSHTSGTRLALSSPMATFLKWTLAITAATAAGLMATGAIQRGRRSVRKGLQNAESMVDHTRQAVEQVQQSVHKARTSI